MNEEVWKDIPGYEGLYQVSNLGRVRSLPRLIKMPYTGYKITKEIILKKILTSNGYYRVNLQGKNYSIHRLVANAFIPNPNNYPDINHINEDKSNNRVDNLEWCLHKYNCNYGRRNMKISKTKCKSINQYDLQNNLIKTWSSIIEAEKALHLSNIGRCCSNNVKYKTIGGYIWRYADK